jgi:hypothetical protein
VLFYPCNPSTQEAEVGGRIVSSRSGLHGEAPSKKNLKRSTYEKEKKPNTELVFGDALQV